MSDVSAHPFERVLAGTWLEIVYTTGHKRSLFLIIRDRLSHIENIENIPQEKQ
jgi:hypothetical protein